MGYWVVTGSTKGEVARLVPGSNVNVFIPTTPNPTSGFAFLSVKDIIRLDMTNEETVKLVMSGGFVAAGWTLMLAESEKGRCEKAGSKKVYQRPPKKRIKRKLARR